MPRSGCSRSTRRWRRRCTIRWHGRPCTDRCCANRAWPTIVEAIAQGRPHGVLRGRDRRNGSRAAVQAAGGWMTADDLASHTRRRARTAVDRVPGRHGVRDAAEFAGADPARGTEDPRRVTTSRSGRTSRRTRCITWSRRRSWRSKTGSGSRVIATFVGFEPRQLLSDEWAASRRAAIDPQRARRIGRGGDLDRYDVVRCRRRRWQRVFVHPEPVRAIGDRPSCMPSWASC